VRTRSRNSALLVVVVVMLAAGCGRGAAIPASSQPRPVDGGTLRYALLADPASVTPLRGGDEAGLIVERNVFAGLVDVDPGTLEVVPSIARSWSASGDGRSFTFHLRSGVRFQDGAGAVTAETFVRDWSLLCSPATASPNAAVLSAVSGYDACRHGGALSGVRAAGPLTLVVTLDRPFRDFATVLTDPATWAFPPDRVSTPGGLAAFESNPVGAGPFQIASWRRGEAVAGKKIERGEVVLDRYPGYFGRPAHLQRVDLPVVDAANLADSFARYRSRGLDVLELAATRVDVVLADLTFSRQLIRYPRLQLIALVATDPRTSSVQQRAALAVAIDPSAIVTDVFGKAGQTADGLVPVGMPGFLPGVAPQPLPDPSAPPIGKVVLQRPTQPLLQAMADSLVHRLGHAGVEVSVAGSGDYELRVLDAGYPSPDALLARITAATGAPAGLLDAARAAADPGARAALYVEAERRLISARIVIPIAYGQTQLLVASRVHDLLYDARGGPRLAAAWLGSQSLSR
jgi:ABC-type transport system substrate-binding protein